MNDLIVLHDIPWTLDVEAMARRLHIKPASKSYAEFEKLCAEAVQVGKPAAMARTGFISELDETGVIIEGEHFVSRVLSVNLQGKQRVFAYVATCGCEINAWAESLEDLLLQYEAEAIKEVVLGAAIAALKQTIDEQYHPGKTSTMAPGSLADWPIREQRPLFNVLGDTQNLIGVALGETMLMTPNKSVSGIRFAVEEDFYSCLLCPREGCPDRRMAYKPELYDERYVGAARSTGM